MPELSYKTRRALSAILILVWLPIYVVLAVSILGALPRMNIIFEVLIYVIAAFAWAIPFKFIFKGVGKPDPNAPKKKFLDDDFLASEKANRNRKP